MGPESNEAIRVIFQAVLKLAAISKAYKDYKSLPLAFSYYKRKNFNTLATLLTLAIRKCRYTLTSFYLTQLAFKVAKKEF
jgi:hypothetical protein